MTAFSVTIPADRAAPSAARRIIRDFLAPDLPEDAVDRAELLSSELVAKGVMHSELAVRGEVEVDLDLDAQRLRITVWDTDADFDLTLIGGWGLALLDRLASRWGIERNRPNNVWFELDR